MRNVVLRQHLVQYRILGNAALLTVCLLEIREDLQQPENALATLLSLIRSARMTERLVTAPRGETYYNERPRGRGGRFFGKERGKAGEQKRGRIGQRQ